MYQEQQFTKNKIHTGALCEKISDSCRQSSFFRNYVYQDSCGPRSAISCASSLKPMQFVNEFGKFGKFGKGKDKNKTSYERPKSDSVLIGADKQTAIGDEGAAYHHVVPFNKLAAFWDCLIMEANTGNITDLQKIMLQVVTLYFNQMDTTVVKERTFKPKENEATSFLAPDGITVVTKEDLLKFISNLTMEKLFSKENEKSGTLLLEGKEKQMLDLVAMMYTWMPFNLVKGKANRDHDPGEEFDQAAAEITEDPQQYRELMVLMKKYETASSKEERTKIREAIEIIIGLNAYVGVLGAMNPELPLPDFTTTDVKVRNRLIEEIKQLIENIKSQPDPATKKEKKAREENLKKLDKLVSKGAKDSELQAFNSEMLFERYKDDTLVTSTIRKLESIVNNAADSGTVEPLTGRHFRVEYGSGFGNNCFFYALAVLGFTSVGTVEDMRGIMNVLRGSVVDEIEEGSEIKEVVVSKEAKKVDSVVDESYHPEGMITEADIQLFANYVEIRVNLFTIADGRLQPAGVIGERGKFYNIVHYVNHYMPMYLVGAAPDTAVIVESPTNDDL